MAARVILGVVLGWCSVRRAYVKDMKTEISDKHLLSAFRFWPNFAVKSTSASFCEVQDLRPGSDTGCCDWTFLLRVRQSEVKSYLKRNRDQSLPYLFSKSFAASRWT